MYISVVTFDNGSSAISKSSSETNTRDAFIGFLNKDGQIYRIGDSYSSRRHAIQIVKKYYKVKKIRRQKNVTRFQIIEPITE